MPSIYKNYTHWIDAPCRRPSWQDASQGGVYVVLDMDCPGLPIQEGCSSVQAWGAPGAATSWGDGRVRIIQATRRGFGEEGHMVPAGLQQPNRTVKTARTADALAPPAVCLGSDPHHSGPVTKLGAGADAKPARTARAVRTDAAAGGGSEGQQ